MTTLEDDVQPFGARPPSELREIRGALGLSQRVLATRLGVSTESFRVWESGRRLVPDDVRERAAHLARLSQSSFPMALSTLAKVLGVSEMTLRNAVRSGRLPIAADAPLFLGKPILRALRVDGESFLENHYRRAPRRNSRPRPCPNGLPRVAADCAQRVRILRTRLRLSQREFAHHLGAAGKAVVYQWESGKRRPSPALWSRLIRLGV